MTGAVIQAVLEARWGQEELGQVSGRFCDGDSERGLTGDGPTMGAVQGPGLPQVLLGCSGVCDGVPTGDVKGAWVGPTVGLLGRL